MLGPSVHAPPLMDDDSMPRGEIIGVVIGAVALFSLISVIPVTIMWYHRRRAAAHAMSETQVVPPIYQVPMQNVLGQPVSVDRWLEEQNVPAHAQQYGQDTCSICLCPLASSPYLTCPDPAVLAHAHNHPPCTCGAHHAPPEQVLVLNRCKHAFHLECLKSWFEYRRYKCPICQASYSPDEARG